MNTNIYPILGAIGVLLVALILLGLIVFWISNHRSKKKSQQSMPSFGTDRSTFAKDIQARYKNEKPNYRNESDLN